jgi:hypothetical protein
VHCQHWQWVHRANIGPASRHDAHIELCKSQFS